MAAVALVDASRGTSLAVRAAVKGLAIDGAGAGGVIDCGADAPVPADATLVVVEVERGATDLEVRLGSCDAPVLLLVPRGAGPLPPVGARRWASVEKPCEPVLLRAAIRELLHGGESSSPSAHAAPPRTGRWLDAPLVPAGAAPLLAAAARLGGPVWIVGEAGTGTDRVAAALVRAHAGDVDPLRWPFDESLASVAAATRPAVLPGLDRLDARDLGRIEQFLAFEPQGLVVATSGDDPESAVAEGRLPLSLYRRLSATALRLPPLRERSGDVGALASAIASDVAARAFGEAACTLDASALDALAAYPWPGNYEELEAVVTRSVLGAARRDDGALVLAEADLRFALDLSSGAAPAGGAHGSVSDAPSARKAVVVELDAARAGRTSGDASTGDGQAADFAADSNAGGASSAAAIEAVLASLAHDLNNPMVTVRTFAALAAASADDDSGELARQAAADADRIAGHLAFLQRFAELPAESRGPSRVDAFETLGDAIEAAEASASVEVLARAALWWEADADLARFVADAIVAECSGRTGDDAEPASVDLAADRRGLEVRIALGGAAVDRLGKFLGGSALPWRLALAREAARRAGGDLELHVKDEEMRLLWRAPVVEEANHDEQAGRADRRRRSRGS